MYLADYHTHTRFSPDGSATMTEMAQAALDAGMDEICFTDHVEPLVWGSEERHPPYDWSALTEDFVAAQAALGDQIQLRLGMELGDAEWDPAHVKTPLFLHAGKCRTGTGGDRGLSKRGAGIG